MKVRSAFFVLCYVGTTAACIALAGCSSGDSRAAEAYAEYQAAESAGDLASARKALLRLVKEDDDVADYWSALGGVQLRLGANADAYYAFSRADELDRGNAQTLGALTQLALVSGELNIAERHAKQLALINPNDPAAPLVFGYVALRRQDLNSAEEYADQLLARFPHDPSAKLLKARILLARRTPEEAIQLLEAQLQSQPNDLSSLKALLALRKRNGEWLQVSLVAMRMWELRQANFEYGRLAIEAAFRANEIPRVRELSRRFLQPDSPPEQVSKVLELWADHWKSPAALEEARSLSRSSGPSQTLAFATFFNDVGSPEDTAALLGARPSLPISAGNASSNALIAASMAIRGNTGEAKTLLEAILKIEPDHVYALTSLVNLKIRAGVPRAAIKDAQRLVTITPQSARAWLLLARAYAAASDKRQLDRTLWNAFHELPANHDIHETLRSHVQNTSGAAAARAVDEEFEQQQQALLAREFF